MVSTGPKGLVARIRQRHQDQEEREHALGSEVAVVDPVPEIKVFSELKGEFVGDGNRITGMFVGTGRYAGVTGEYTFQWQDVVDSGDGSVSGRMVGLKGRARLDPSSGAQTR